MRLFRNDNESYSAGYEGFGPPGIMDEWRWYITNIVATGNDPLGFFTVPPASDNTRREWEVRVMDAVEVLGCEGVTLYLLLGVPDIMVVVKVGIITVFWITVVDALRTEG